MTAVLLAGAAALAHGALTGFRLFLLFLSGRRAPVLPREPRPDRPADSFEDAMLDAELGMSVFECPRWRATGGECCPHGTVALDCPGLAALVNRVEPRGSA